MTGRVDRHGAGRHMPCPGKMKAVHRETARRSTHAEPSEAVEGMERSTGFPAWTHYLGKAQR